MGINGISSGCYPTEYGNKILQDIKNTDNPVMKAIRLSVHLSNMLKENIINICEAYLLQGEIIHYRREGYTLPAWNDTVQISTCLTILNQFVTPRRKFLLHNPGTKCIIIMKNV